jgi:hypothetical protein
MHLSKKKNAAVLTLWRVVGSGASLLEQVELDYHLSPEVLAFILFGRLKSVL